LGAVVLSGGIASIVVYIPFFNDILGSGPVDILPLVMAFAAGVLYLLWEFGRRFLHFKGIAKYLGVSKLYNF
jgi:hypothetical protein